MLYTQLNLIIAVFDSTYFTFFSKSKIMTFTFFESLHTFSQTLNNSNNNNNNNNNNICISILNFQNVINSSVVHSLLRLLPKFAENPPVTLSYSANKQTNSDKNSTPAKRGGGKQWQRADQCYFSYDFVQFQFELQFLSF